MLLLKDGLCSHGEFFFDFFMEERDGYVGAIIRADLISNTEYYKLELSESMTQLRL